MKYLFQFALLLLTIHLACSKSLPDKAALANAETYLEHYHSGEIDALAKFLHQDITFSDPTGEILGEGLEIVGKEQTLAALKKMFSAVRNLNFTEDRFFNSGSFAVSMGQISYSAQGPQNKAVKVSYTVVTVIELKDGLVYRHTDYADYESMLGAFK